MKSPMAVGCVLMFSGVAFGAFGAHALKGVIGDRMDIYHTATLYHLVHGLGALMIANLTSIPKSRMNLVVKLFALGVLLFSGSLYLLAISGVKWFGAITPLGGVCFLVGWAVMGTGKDR